LEGRETNCLGKIKNEMKKTDVGNMVFGEKAREITKVWRAISRRRV
jgi:hypothetical protein